MRAFVLDDSPALKEVSVPELQPGEAVVRVKLAGICGTDLELLAGYRGFRGIPGHEMVGVVESASDPGWIGKRVVSEINVVCHACSMCLEGLHRHCEKRRVIGIDGRDGTFAEFVVEATGFPEGLEVARAWTRPRGTIVLKSTCHEPARINASRIVVDELRLVRSRCGDFEPSLESLATKSIPVTELVSAIHPFRDIEQALQDSSRPETFKILLDFRAKP